MDTNVLVAANGGAAQASLECVGECVNRLLSVQRTELLVLDAAGLILHEYGRQPSLGGPPGPGGAFLKWLYRNWANAERCELVPLTRRSGPAEDFVEFPSDPDLAAFDPSDRKFAAVALASKHRPLVVNATGTDWWDHRAALERHGVKVEFLCVDLMAGPDAARSSA